MNYVMQLVVQECCIASRKALLRVLQAMLKVAATCCTKLRTGYAQQRVSTCNATLLRDKLQENIARINCPYMGLSVTGNIVAETMFPVMFPGWLN